LTGDESRSVLAKISEFPRLMLERDSSALIFRINAVPGMMAALVAKLRAVALQGELDFVSLARAAGILYAAFLPPMENSAAPETLARTVTEVFRVCALPELRVSAMLEWAPAEIKTGPETVWGPPRPDFELMRRVKRSFDPQNVLAPGRFAGGI
jgi:glycolate oxidase FAD binding subunit